MAFAISNYTQAAKLMTPQANLDTLIGEGEEKHNDAFKKELSGVLPNAYQGLKEQGKAADTQVVQHILGVGNVEQTAISLSDLNANIEVIAQALRIGIEKLNELTARTMGG